MSKPTEESEKERIKAMYDGLFELFGIIKDDIPDASTTIDDVLYGENGTWRGTQDDDKNQA
jgi:hypothetical protein